MDCEPALQLISARIDREITADDQAALEAHLAECATCRVVAEAFHLQDLDLASGFAPLRHQADTAGQKVIAEIRSCPVVASPRRRIGHFTIMSLVSATAALVALAVYWWQRPALPLRQPAPGGRAANVEMVNAPARPGYLAAKPRLPATAPQPLAVGDTLQTQTGQRRRLALPDGSILFVNQSTSLKVVSDRRVTLTAGEIYLEVAPLPESPFVVETGQREVRALGTRFSVRADEAGPGVVVTQGSVRISGLSSLIQAGQQLAPGGSGASAAPRASYLLDWTRELLAAAESPLVPKSEHCGGSLIALDPHGQQAKLSLRRYRVDVHIEDGFARTTIDQTYFNHLNQRLEGTFYFPLPPDASLSRLAMYVVDGNQCTLNEGGMCERNYARQVFEQIVTRMQDPALLEWIDGSTFKMRVFPLEARQEKRVILSYTQKLDSLYGQTAYRFPAGHNMDRVGNWSVHIRAKGAAKQAWQSRTHPLKSIPDSADLVLEYQANDAKLDQDVYLSIADAAAGRNEARFSLAEHEGAKYLMLRYRPDLSAAIGKPQSETRQRTDWVFLFESSGDRDPLLARTQIDVIRTLLANINHDDTFTILTAATRVGKVVDKLPVTPDNVQAALDALGRIHLVGALDMGQAIAAVEPFLKEAKQPCLVHVGSGIPVLGERGEDVLAKRLREDVPYVGIGIGKRWSRNFMKLAAERTSGIFTQINPDEDVSWRAFDLFSTLRTPRLLGIKIVDDAEKARFLSHGSAIAHGEEICAIARIDQGGALPKSISVSGTLNGKIFTQELPVQDVAAKADYLPRTWAKLEIDRLLAENAEGNKAKIIELSKQMYVMTPFTSLLVLENEAMYQQYNVDRGRKDHWALYPCPPKIPIVHEPLPNEPFVRNPTTANQQANQKPTAEQVLQTVMVRMPPRFFQDPYGRHYGNALTVWQLLNQAYAVPVSGPDDFELFLEGALESPRTSTGRIWREGTITTTSGGTTPGTSRLSQFDDRWGGSGIAPDLPVFATKPQSAAEGQRGPREPGFRRPVMDAFDFQSSVDGDFKTQPVGNQFAQQYMPSRENFRSDGRREDSIWKEQFGQLRGFDGLEEWNEVDGRVKKRGLLSQRGWDFRFAENVSTIQIADHFVAHMFSGQGRNQLHYYRPSFTGDERFFTDLISYAPGMNSRRADILAVLETEARPFEAWKSGQVDPAAGQLIDAARAAGWRKLTVGPEGRRSSITFDGTGRYRYQRTLSLGLREEVICDGQTLWHLYPELAVGAKRDVSRFHRAEFAALVPGVLPPATDLAHGADVKHVAERTIHIVPLGAETARDKDKKPVPYTVAQYLFGRDGQLAEYGVVEMPANKLLFRETYQADTIRRFDAEGKELSAVQVQWEQTDAPELAPQTGGLVVLPLPYRTRAHVFQARKISDIKKMDEQTALLLLAADFAGWNNWEMLNIFHQHYMGDMGSIGIYTLLASAGMNVNDQPEPNQAGQHGLQSVLTKFGKEPLAKYLAQISNGNRRYQMSEQKLDLPAGSFLNSLSGFRGLWMPWRNGNYPSGDEAARKQQIEQVLAFIKSNSGSPFAWAMLDTILNRGYQHEAARYGLIDALQHYEKDADLAYYVKYEIARLTLNTDQAQARKLYTELYQQTFKAGALPVFDGSLRQALVNESVEEGLSNGYFELIRQTAGQLLKNKHYGGVIGLAWQVQQQGDAFLADELLQRVLGEVPAAQRLPATLAVIENYWHASQFGRADALLGPILDDPKTRDNPTLWRLAAALAQRQQKLMRAIACLEKALEIEYRQLPEVINLQTVRRDFSTLLNAYGAVAHMYGTLETPAPPEFTAQVIRTADRWRTLDPDGTHACQSAAVVLRAAGKKELAWDYLTTPISLRPNEGATYHSLAQNLQGQNEMDLADKAYVLAFESEPTNAQLLWDRAQMLQHAGRYADARKVYQRLADGQWQSRFGWMQQQARWHLGQQAWR